MPISVERSSVAHPVDVVMQLVQSDQHGARAVITEILRNRADWLLGSSTLANEKSVAAKLPAPDRHTGYQANPCDRLKVWGKANKSLVNRRALAALLDLKVAFLNRFPMRAIVLCLLVP